MNLVEVPTIKCKRLQVHKLYIKWMELTHFGVESYFEIYIFMVVRSSMYKILSIDVTHVL